MFARNDLSVFDWFVVWFLMAVPFVNVVLWIVLVFSGGTNKTLKNYLIAQVFIGFVVGFFFMLLMGSGFLIPLLEQLQY